MATCGGFGGAKEATAEEQAILESVKGEVEAHLDANHTEDSPINPI
eukprot:CAMPEP_0170420754 /NCGR_PEP_ID=MMETSP0117_2-20130122/35515_1 /TAXON_ID=400756 /ORGANISM="Durinskia baltica, Strain CSIRO CS-38" /LENGTH=45 /DNA_ID= /DNA_START= /DNA_END= /DNA_ORIENTATION=